MSPIQIEIVFHYYTRTNDWRGDEWDDFPLLRETLQGHVDSGLLVDLGDESSVQYQITDKGLAYVEAVMALPLPVQKWSMP